MDKKANLILGLAGLGMAAGLWYAYKTDKKFWGYVGFGLLGQMAGLGAARILSTIILK
jgi:hypothetical protein